LRAGRAGDRAERAGLRRRARLRRHRSAASAGRPAGGRQPLVNRVDRGSGRRGATPGGLSHASLGEPPTVPHRILVTDKLADEGLELLRAAPGLEVVVATKLGAAALRAALAEADGIIIRSGTQLTAEVLKDQARLKAIVRAGVGVDNIDVPAATRQGIVVMNTPGGNTVSTAEHTMTLMLALSRNVPKANDSLKAGRW